MILAIYFDPENSAPLGLAGLATFIPGTNWIESEAWEKAQEHPIMKMWVDAGQLREIQRKDPKSSDCSTISFSETDAILLVSGEYELVKLRKWLETEDRKPVLQAIAERIKRLEAFNTPQSFARNGHGLRESREAWCYLLGPRASSATPKTTAMVW